MTSYSPEIRYPGTLPGWLGILSLFFLVTGIIGAPFQDFFFFVFVTGYFLLLFAYTLYSMNIFELGGNYSILALMTLVIPGITMVFLADSGPAGAGEVIGSLVLLILCSYAFLWVLVKLKRRIFRTEPINGTPNMGFVVLSTVSLVVFLVAIVGASGMGYSLPDAIRPVAAEARGSVTPTPVVTTHPRPATGTFFSGRYQSASFGNIILDNKEGTDDAVVALISRDRKLPDIAVYVRKGDLFTVSNVLNGVYDVYVTKGKDWDNSIKKFTIDALYIRFADPIRFTASGSIEGNYDITRYINWRITLYSTPENSAETEEITEGAFPPL